MAESGWNRREFVGAASLFALVVGLPAAVTSCTDSADEADAPTDRQIALMTAVAEHVLPTTDTPGAGEADVGPFVLLALAHGLDGTRAPVTGAEMPYAFPEYRRPDGSLRYANWLEDALDGRASGDWLRLPEPRRAELLAALDAEAFAADAGEHPWKKVKGLILTGYYTSEIGGSQELQYELVPGRWDPKVPLAPDARAYSSDWTGVEFG